MGEKWKGLERLNRETLVKVSDVFKESPDIVDVEVYGSLSRQSEGGDLDLILIVDSIETETRFYNLMKAELAKPAEERDFANLADQVVTDGGRLLRRASSLCSNRMNILVHERTWKDRISAIQSNSFHYDPLFLQTIAQDAKLVSEL